MSQPLTRRQKLEALLAQEPDDPFLKYALAMECANEGDDHAAVDWFQRLTQEHPDYVAGYHQFGKLLLRLGHVQEAEAVLQRGIAKARQLGDLHAAEEMEALLTGQA